MRANAIAVLALALYASDPMVAVRATRSLAKVISEFRPKMREVPTSEEQVWQDEERFEALELLEVRIDAGGISMQQTWKIHRILLAVARSDRQTEAIKARARAVSAKLSYPEQFPLFNLFCTWNGRTGRWTTTSLLSRISAGQLKRPHGLSSTRPAPIQETVSRGSKICFNSPMMPASRSGALSERSPHSAGMRIFCPPCPTACR
jgi:hypothetical protein